MHYPLLCVTVSWFMDDTDRAIDAAKRKYARHPLARLKALLPTIVEHKDCTQFLSYDQPAILELISEREQDLAHEIAKKARRVSWLALAVAVLAVVFAGWTLWIRVSELQSRPLNANPQIALPLPVTTPPPTTSAAPASSSPHAGAAPLLNQPLPAPQAQ